MKKILLYGYGGAYNHGGEAIVVCTIDYLRHKCSDCFIYLSTHFRKQDIEFHIPADCILERDEQYVLLDKNASTPGMYDKQIYASTLEVIEPDMECYSVGGDNYCYGNWHRWKTIHDEILRKGAKDVLWSCSIDEEYLTDDLVQHLKTFEMITAREGLTYQSLQGHGLQNVKKCKDIAFGLKAIRPAKLYGLEEGNTVVLNLSPLVIRREQKTGIVIDNYKCLIEYILSETNMHVLLLPHVRMPADNDLEPLSLLYECYADNPRIHLVDDNLSAAECKYLISRCNLGVFARTHAAIAAYSSGVPCIVIGYSVKARGIALDMDQERYHVPLESIINRRLLLDKMIQCFDENDI